MRWQRPSQAPFNSAMRSFSRRSAVALGDVIVESTSNLAQPWQDRGVLLAVRLHQVAAPVMSNAYVSMNSIPYAILMLFAWASN